MKIRITINGAARSVDVDPPALLSDVLRTEYALTSVHVGCDTSSCGACTVLVDGAAVKACTILAVQADGSSITTIEGLSGDGPPTAVQEAFGAEHALQCGFCTAGMVMAVTALLDAIPAPSDDEIRHGLEGNLCRCTGYVNILRAVRRAAAARTGTVPAPVAGESLRIPLARSGETTVAAHGDDVEVV